MNRETGIEKALKANARANRVNARGLMQQAEKMPASPLDPSLVPDRPVSPLASVADHLIDQAPTIVPGGVSPAVAPVPGTPAPERRAGVVGRQGGGLFLRPQWLTYGAKHGLDGARLGQAGQTCWLVNKYTGQQVLWTGQNWHADPESDWWINCEYYAQAPAPPNTFTAPAPAPAPAPSSGGGEIVRPSPLAPSIKDAPVSIAPMPPKIVGGNVYPGDPAAYPQDWGGEGQQLPGEEKPAGFPWWLVAVAGSLLIGG
jgi:hypothetical protein